MDVVLDTNFRGNGILRNGEEGRRHYAPSTQAGKFLEEMTHKTVGDILEVHRNHKAD